MIDEILNDNNFEKSDTEIQTNESIEKNKLSSGFWRWWYIYPRRSKQKELSDPRIQAMFKRSR